jgi:myo-inositol-1(or 4)-monophosphatase
MKTKDLNKYLDFTTALAQKAGDLQMEYFGKDIQIDLKQPRDLVTEVDKKCEELIVSTIRSQYPDHHILSEEGSGDSKDKSGFRWIIDPIDGTTDYAHRHPFFAVSIGLEIEGELSVGVVYAPYLREMFKAAKGSGAFLNDKQITVSKAETLEESLLATGFNPRIGIKNVSHFKHFLPLSQGIRRGGSAALDICYIACGRLDGYWEDGLNPWDMAAGVVIAREAGATVTIKNGNEFITDGDELLITNGKIHEEMAEYFRSQNL